MRTIIAGGRDYKYTMGDFELLDKLRKEIPITSVVCGMAKGADMLGLLWAESRNIPVAKFPADWNKHGRAAGPIRNKQMAENADALIAFPGGSGTANMLSQARLKGLKIFDLT